MGRSSRRAAPVLLAVPALVLAGLLSGLLAGCASAPAAAAPVGSSAAGAPAADVASTALVAPDLGAPFGLDLTSAIEHTDENALGRVLGARESAGQGWTEPQTEQLVRSGLALQDGTRFEPDGATCEGQTEGLVTARQFRLLTCLLESAQVRPFVVRVKADGSGGAGWYFLGWL